MLDRSFLSDILNTLFERSMSKRSNKDQRSINDLCLALLNTEGEVSGLSLAGSIAKSSNLKLDALNKT